MNIILGKFMFFRYKNVLITKVFVSGFRKNSLRVSVRTKSINIISAKILQMAKKLSPLELMINSLFNIKKV